MFMYGNHCFLFIHLTTSVAFLFINDVLCYFVGQQCYKEIKPGMYGSLGKVMEGNNQWYVT